MKLPSFDETKILANEIPEEKALSAKNLSTKSAFQTFA